MQSWLCAECLLSLAKVAGLLPAQIFSVPVTLLGVTLLTQTRRNKNSSAPEEPVSP